MADGNMFPDPMTVAELLVRRPPDVARWPKGKTSCAVNVMHDWGAVRRSCQWPGSPGHSGTIAATPGRTRGESVRLRTQP